jgi:hypothetical protein
MMSHAVNKKAFSNGSKSVEDEFFFLKYLRTTLTSPGFQLKLK